MTLFKKAVGADVKKFVSISTVIPSVYSNFMDNLNNIHLYPSI